MCTCGWPWARLLASFHCQGLLIAARRLSCGAHRPQQALLHAAGRIPLDYYYSGTCLASSQSRPVECQLSPSWTQLGGHGRRRPPPPSSSYNSDMLAQAAASVDAAAPPPGKVSPHHLLHTLLLCVCLCVCDRVDSRAKTTTHFKARCHVANGGGGVVSHRSNSNSSDNASSFRFLHTDDLLSWYDLIQYTYHF